MTAPRWTAEVLRRLAPPAGAEDVLGDLEEAHRGRVRRRGRVIASVLTGVEALDMALALIRLRIGRRRAANPQAPADPASPGRARKGPGISWLDVKLGVRMLLKYPGLTLVGGLGMAVAIALGAASFDVKAAIFSRLALDEGDRVVAIENWDTRWNDQERQILHDFVAWRDELKSVRELGAFRDITRNLITSDGPAGPVPVAEMTGSGFRVARVPPLLGRTLVEADERVGAPAVVVIGHDVWRTRFASDPAVIGREVRLGNTVHTVVGVMPEDFAFPVNHELWVPLRANPSDFERRNGPAIFVFGRLAPGASLEEAQAELTTLGERAAAAYPRTHERLRARVVSYRLQFFDDLRGWEFPLLQLVVVLLLVVVCANVAILVYARTATRRAEIAVRSALGASRRRIVGQLFVEALVLSAGAAAVGLVIVRLAYTKVNAFLAMRDVPFWIDFGLSSSTVVYVSALTALGAVLVGVVPALQATGRRMQSGIARMGGGTAMRFGRTWTALIIAQVAFSVAALPAAIVAGSTFIRHAVADPGFAAEAFVTARLLIDRETPPSADVEAYERELQARYVSLHAELVRRLEAEPGVSDVITLEGVPGQEPSARIEVERAPARVEPDAGERAGSSGVVVGTRTIDIDHFDVFDVPILAGRRFHAGDLGAEATVRLRDGDGDGHAELDYGDQRATSTAAIVNESFVQQVLGGGSPLGRRVRYADRGNAEPGVWYEIVGVVSDFPANPMEPDQTQAKLYHPIAPGQVFERIAVRLRGAGPAAFAGRLREITAELDPSLRLTSILTLDELLREEQGLMRIGALTIGLVMLSVLLLSAAGIYALMSFTVAQRRREIGVRVALGADPRRILGSIFSRALWRLAIGVVVGIAIATLLDRGTGGELTGGDAAVLLPAVSLFMAAVGLLATLGPARRGLRIQPSEALRGE